MFIELVRVNGTIITWNSSIVDGVEVEKGVVTVSFSKEVKGSFTAVYDDIKEMKLLSGEMKVYGY